MQFQSLGGVLGPGGGEEYTLPSLSSLSYVLTGSVRVHLPALEVVEGEGGTSSTGFTLSLLLPVPFT